jgi:hypothetical protein
VHVLDVDGQGRATVRPPVDAPVGDSITATLKDIFGVSSRFDIQTEEQLHEWNILAERAQSSRLESQQRMRFRELTDILATRSEDLRSIVSSPGRLSSAVVHSLTQDHGVNVKKRPVSLKRSSRPRAKSR